MSLCDREGGRRESERERGRGNLDFVRFDAQETIKLHSRQEVLLIGEAGSRGYCPALRYDSTADATRVLKHKDQLALPHSPPLPPSWLGFVCTLLQLDLEKLKLLQAEGARTACRDLAGN